MNLTKFVPFVIGKDTKKKEFDPTIIFNVLIDETNIPREEAVIITEETTRFLISISTNIKNITSPMIREIVNTMLLKHGFEAERLKNTRIGFPRYDLEKIYKENNPVDAYKKMINHINTEFKNVNKLIKIANNKKVYENGDIKWKKKE